MELHPILDRETAPNLGLWYVFSAVGDSPTMRVGHSCIFVRGSTAHDNGKLYVIGGANPSGSFCDTYILNLNTWKWDVLDSPGLRARYEHASFIPACQPNKIYVFAGADQAGNMNDLQALDTDNNTWTTVNPSGTPPSARTHHTAAVVDSKLIVYSGGHSGVDPIGDRQVHAYDAESNKWSILSLRGDAPKPRHGHVMVAIGNRVFVHGGMAGSTFYNDLHILDIEKSLWTDVKRRKLFPSARAGHCGVANGSNIYIFGGMNRDGALDDMFKLDTLNMVWSKIELQGPAPACRLDFGMCVVEMSIKCSELPIQTANLMAASSFAKDVLEQELKPDSASSRDSRQEAVSESSSISADEQAISPESDTLPDVEKNKTSDQTNAACAAESSIAGQTFSFCLVHGGMDTEGEIFDDMLVYLLE